MPFGSLKSLGVSLATTSVNGNQQPLALLDRTALRKGRKRRDPKKRYVEGQR